LSLVTSGLVNRIVLNSGTKARTSSLGEGICSTTTEEESTKNGCNYDSSHGSCSNSCCESDNSSTAVSSSLDITTCAVGYVASRSCTVVSVRADNRNINATLNYVTLDVVANIFGSAVDGTVDTRVGEVG